MRLFTHEKLTISINELQGKPYIKEKWSGVLSSKIFHQLINRSLDIYRKEIPKIKSGEDSLLMLADVTDIEIISAKDIDWLTNEINPIYEEIGFTHQAVIAPKSQIAQTTVSDYEGQIGKFETKMFTNELDGVRWFVAT